MLKNKASEIKALLNLLKPHKRLLVQFAGSLLVSSSVTLCFPLALKDLFNIATSSPTPDQILYCVSKWTGVITVGGASTYVRRYTIDDLSNRIAKSMREEYFSELMQKKLEGVNEQNTGSLTHQLSNDIWQVASTVTNEFSSSLRGVAFFVGGVGFLVYTCPTLSLVSVVPMLGLGAVSRYYGQILRKERQKQAQLLRDQNAYAQERLAQIKTVKLFTAERFEIQKYGQKQKEFYNKSLDVASYTAKHFAFMEILGQNSVLWCLGGGAYLITTGSGLSVGSLTAFAMYSVYAGMGFRLLTSGYTEFKKAAGIYDQIITTQKKLEEKEQVLLERMQPQYTKGPSISFRNVTFAYPGREANILEGINLNVKPGEVLGIVGKSGSGKSTMFHLLTHLYRPKSGNIYLDGVDISTKPAWWARQLVSIVSQEAFLFSATIKENIIYSNPEATMEQIEEACRRADALSFISQLPHEFETQVGEGGLSLSGGQRQRIAIARALLKTPHILLLDEATSGLDAKSDAYVKKILEEEIKREKHTVLMITHRIKNLRNLADRIAVLDAGKLKKVGTFENLKNIQDFKILM